MQPLEGGYDCASLDEIMKVMELGVEANRIIYANPCKDVRYEERPRSETEA